MTLKTVADIAKVNERERGGDGRLCCYQYNASVDIYFALLGYCSRLAYENIESGSITQHSYLHAFVVHLLTCLEQRKKREK